MSVPSKINRSLFFPYVREHVFHGHLNDQQVTGINSMLDFWDAHMSGKDLRFLAYPMATTVLESAHTMQPIKERGTNSYFTRMYDIRGSRPKTAKALGNTTPGDGIRYCGRGLCQITGRKNYAWATKATGVDCIANPDALLDPRTACYVLFAGMILGHFTDKKLSDYFTDTTSDPINARRIINGLDKAADIAQDYQSILTALRLK